MEQPKGSMTHRRIENFLPTLLLEIVSVVNWRRVCYERVLLTITFVTS